MNNYSIARNLIKKSIYCSISTINGDGLPHVTPIGSIYLLLHPNQGLKSKSRQFRPHDLRHTFITDIVDKMGGDVSVNFAREVWGHTEVKTLQRYVHLAEALVQETQSRSSAEDVEELEIKAL